jgi:hypothetical protein
VIEKPDFRRIADGALAQFVKDGASPNYDHDLVAWIDGFIERNRERFAEKDIDRVASMLASVVGECMIAVYGGSWVFNEKQGEWGIDLGEGLGTAFPASKIAKHLRNGSEDSVLSFFEVVGIIIQRGGIDNLQSSQNSPEG